MHSPTTAAAFDCLCRQMLRGKTVVLLFEIVQLLCLESFGLGALLQYWRRLFSRQSPLCSMLGVARISPVVPLRFLCTRMDSFLSKAANRIIAVLAHSVNTSQANSPQRSAKHPRHTRQAPAIFHNAPQRHPRNTCQSPAIIPQRSTKTSAKHVPFTRDVPRRFTKHPRYRCQPPASFPHRSRGHPCNTFQSPASIPPSHFRVHDNVPQDIRVTRAAPWRSVLEPSIVHPLPYFISQLSRSSTNIQKSLAIWLPSLARDHLLAMLHVRPRPE